MKVTTEEHNTENISMAEYFAYLERLRESGETNMYGAVPYLQREFPELAFDRSRAHEILTAWMRSYDEPDKKGNED